MARLRATSKESVRLGRPTAHGTRVEGPTRGPGDVAEGRRIAGNHSLGWVAFRSSTEEAWTREPA